jgi:cytochrome P450
VQSKLRSEIRSVLSHAAAEKRIPTVQEITKTTIPYMDAVMEEIIRHSLTEAGVVRTTVVDVEVLGHHIPKGTDVFLMGNGPSIFTPAFQIDDSLRSPSALVAKNIVGTWNPDDIADFKPERWLVEGDGRKVFDAAAGPLLTFGLGPRGCFGRRLAYLELRLVLLLIIWNFELQKCPEGLSGYDAVDKLTHAPQQCYIRLTNVM